MTAIKNTNLSTQEAAKYLGISERTLYRLVRRKIIKANRFGNYLIFDKADLDTYAVSIKNKGKFDPTKYQGKSG